MCFYQQELLAELCAAAGISLSRNRNRKSSGKTRVWGRAEGSDAPTAPGSTSAAGARLESGGGNGRFAVQAAFVSSKLGSCLEATSVFLCRRRALNGLKQCHCQSPPVPVPLLRARSFLAFQPVLCSPPADQPGPPARSHSGDAAKAEANTKAF